MFIYPFFFRFFSYIAYYRISSRVPCAIEQVLVDCLFYVQVCFFWASQVAQTVKNLPLMHEKVKVKDAQLCPTLCNSMDYTAHGILQARILEWESLLQGIFPTQGLNPDLPHCRQVLYQLSHKVMQETRVQSMGRKNPLGKGMATKFSFLAWRIPWTEEPGRLQFIRPHRVRHN